jgi:drug/metabolite transporter (DMT)-like permease
MFGCSVALYLAVRRASLNHLSTQFNNLAMFGVPLIVFIVADIITRPSFAISGSEAVLLIITGTLLSYGGNVASLKSIEIAPNAGYSLIISKSYVLLTSILAVYLFNARLTAMAIAAILFIVGFSALIMINPASSHKARSGAWLPLAAAAFFAWGFLSLMAKFFYAHGMATIVFLTYVFIVVTVCILIEMRARKVSFKPVQSHLLGFLLIGLAAAGFNFFNFQAIRLAPNVGYVNATNAASIGAVTVLSVLLFKDHFSWKKMVGVFGVIAGLFLLFFS